MSSLDVDFALSKQGSELIAAVANLPEDQWFERKSGRIASKDLARPLVAFANAEGGTIVVGIHSGKLDGISSQRENELRQAAIDHTVPPVRTRIEQVAVDDKRILVLRVEPSDSLHTNRAGECFLRIGDESRKLSLAEQRELAFDRGTHPFESTPIELSVEDLSGEEIDAYRVAIGSSTATDMLAARDLVDRRGRLTVAAALLFDARPQREYPNAHVRVLKYDSDERGVGSAMALTEDHRIEGSLPAQIEHAASIIEQLVPHRQQLIASGRFERVPVIPRDAWLEGLVNAVVHRSYSIMGDHTRVEIFPHRIEVSSPGRFPGLVDPRKPLQISRFARDPRIARVCADMGITRELGEGIKRIFEEMQRRGLTEPIYRQTSSSVILILSAADAVDATVMNRLPRSAPQALTVLREQGRPLGTGQVADLAGITRPTASRALQALADAGLVRWEGSSQRDPRATWRLL